MAVKQTVYDNRFQTLFLQASFSKSSTFSVNKFKCSMHLTNQVDCINISLNKIKTIFAEVG